MDAAGLLAAKRLPEASVTIDLGGDGGSTDVLVRALPRRQYRELVDAHPPREGSDDKDWNADTYPPALIAASCVDPSFTLEQAVQAWDEWDTATVGRLFLTAFQLNEFGSKVGFTLPGSAKTGGSGPNSTTASPEA